MIQKDFFLDMGTVPLFLFSSRKIFERRYFS